MRIFLCSYDNFLLAIPMNCVSSIYISSSSNSGLINYDSQNRNTYISLPVFFNYKNGNTCHGIVLKTGDALDDSDSNIIENKTILLSTHIINEKELSPRDFIPVPKSLSFFSGFSVFSGIFFIAHNKTSEELVLLLNPQRLVQTIQKEVKV